MWYMHSGTHRCTDIYKEKKPHGESLQGKTTGEMAALCTHRQAGEEQSRQTKGKTHTGSPSRSAPSTDSQSGWFEKSKERVIEDQFREVTWNKTFLSLRDRGQIIGLSSEKEIRSLESAMI